MAARSAPPVPTGPHHCLVVVHGIGTQQRGSTLTEVGEPLTALIANCFPADWRVQAETDLSPVGDTGATSVTRFYQQSPAPDAGAAEVLWLREAWWAQRFLRPSPAEVLAWSLRVFRAAGCFDLERYEPSGSRLPPLRTRRR